jgi:hypothetical protein
LIFHQAIAPRRHGGVERFHRPAFCDAPEDVGVGEIFYHRAIRKRGWFRIETDRGRTVAVPTLAVAARTVGREELRTGGDPFRVVTERIFETLILRRKVDVEVLIFVFFAFLVFIFVLFRLIGLSSLRFIG